jgi:hypothetical protein
MGEMAIATLQGSQAPAPTTWHGWGVGVLGCWGVGVLGCWRVGVLACWRVGVLACWLGVTHAVVFAHIRKKKQMKFECKPPFFLCRVQS